MTNQLLSALDRRMALKIISGLQNFDPKSVATIVEAATLGGATFIDIAADPNLVRQTKAQTNLPVCVSAIAPEKLAESVNAGADLVEIGNYDSFYAQGRVFSGLEVIALTKATRNLLPEILLSVTVPHTLPLDRQVSLAEELVACGADIIQTEGGTSSNPLHGGILGLIEKAAPTLAAAYAISRAVSVPVLCASGLTDITIPMAIASGASGVGVGSAVNQLSDRIAMIAVVRSLRESLNTSLVLR
jgi:hypothetical protein